jgi:hypothetical protein
MSMGDFKLSIFLPTNNVSLGRKKLYELFRGAVGDSFFYSKSHLFNLGRIYEDLLQML